MKPFTPNRSVTDTLHDLLNSAEVLREMISNRTPESAEMAAIEGRWKRDCLANRSATAAFVPSGSSPAARVSPIRLQSTFAGEQ
jgi:hypothetical protein